MSTIDRNRLNLRIEDTSPPRLRQFPDTLIHTRNLRFTLQPLQLRHSLHQRFNLLPSH